MNPNSSTQQPSRGIPVTAIAGWLLGLTIAMNVLAAETDTVREARAVDPASIQADLATISERLKDQTKNRTHPEVILLRAVGAELRRLLGVIADMGTSNRPARELRRDVYSVRTRLVDLAISPGDDELRQIMVRTRDLTTTISAALNVLVDADAEARDPPAPWHQSSEVSLSLPDRIEYSYRRGGFGAAVNESFAINRRNKHYESDDGAHISTAIVENMLKNLSGWNRSGATKQCRTPNDGFPRHTIRLIGADGSIVVLTSTSSCHSKLPWNLNYRDQLFVGYSPQIADALDRLMTAMRGIAENMSTPSYARAPGQRVRVNNDQEDDRQVFVESDFYHAIVRNAPSFAPYLQYYFPLQLDVYCELGKPDPLCQEVSARIKLVSHSLQYSHVLSALLNRQTLEAIEPDLAYLTKMESLVRTAPLFKSLNASFTPPQSLPAYSFSHHHDAPADRSFMAAIAATSDVTFTAITSHHLDFTIGLFHDTDDEKLWLSSLSLKEGQFERVRTAINFDALLDFIGVKRPLAAGVVHALGLGGCTSISLQIDAAYLQSQPLYRKQLKSRAEHSAQKTVAVKNKGNLVVNEFRLPGRCVYLDLDGVLHLAPQ